MKLLVFGSTGAVGQAVIRQALADSTVRSVVAPTRRALPAQERLENPIIDFEKIDGHEPWWQADAAICCLGTTIAAAGSIAAFRKVDFEYVLTVATLARRGGIQNFGLVSSLGASPRSLSYYSKAKGEIENELRDLNFKTLTLVRPSVIDEPVRAQQRFVERNAVRVLKLFQWIIPRHFHTVTPEQIATVLLDGARSQKVGTHVIENEFLVVR